jgi:CCR4-NOT transcriptional complex subunit CAF120
VFSLNTAGSNRILLSCRNEPNLALWVSALRLAAYEKSRIEEIYTGHLLQTFVRSSNRGGPSLPVGSKEKGTWNEPDSPLIKGRMEGWVRVRVMGGTEWKRLWLVLSAPVSAINAGNRDTGDKRRRSLFGFGGGSQNETASASLAGVASTNEFGGPTPVTEGGTAIFYSAAPVKGTAKSKGPGSDQAVLTVTHVSQA